MRFFEIYQNDLKTFDKLENQLSQDKIDDEMNFHIDSNIENFFSLVDDELVPMCDFLDDGLSVNDFYQKLEQVYFKMLRNVTLTNSLEKKSYLLFFTYF